MDLDTALHPAFLDPRPYLPPWRDGSFDINLDGPYTLITMEKQLEILKHVVYLISNNFDVVQLASSFVETIREAQEREFLSRLLGRGEYAAQALAEKILLPAAEKRNYPLIETLLDSGIDINYQGQCARGFPKRTLLEHAILECDEFLVCSLLKRYISSMKTKRPFQWSRLLNLAMEKANFAIVRAIIRHLEDQLEEKEIVINEKSYAMAVYRGDVKILNLLISKQPQAFEALKKTPWILFEVAVHSNRIEMLKTLQQQSLDICATNSLNQGSPLVCALLHGSIQPAEYLLDNDINLNSYACGFKQEGAAKLYQSFQYKYEANRFAPIYCAVMNGEVEFTSSLISKGIDVNQPGKRFPIQFAVGYGNVEMVQLLLASGADANIVSPPNIDSDYDDQFGFYIDGYIEPHYVSLTPEMSAIQMALELGDEAVYHLLDNSGSRLPIPPSCDCMRTKAACTATMI